MELYDQTLEKTQVEYQVISGRVLRQNAMLSKRNLLFKIKPHSKSSQILLSVEELNDNFLRFPNKNRDNFRYCIHQLKKKGLVSSEKVVDGLKIKLTNSGQMECLKLKMRYSKLLPANKVCVVVFDIPEIEKRQRQVLSNFLEDSAFIRIQKSVWISQFNDAESLSKLFTYLKVKQWIRIFVAEEY